MTTWVSGDPSAIADAPCVPGDHVAVVLPDGSVRIGVVRERVGTIGDGPPPVRWCAEAAPELFDRPEVARARRRPDRPAVATDRTERTVATVVATALEEARS